MNENINLSEILKDCQKGTKLYSSVLGEVRFDGIDTENNYEIKVVYSSKYIKHDNSYFTKKGKYLENAYGECVLFPSKEQRDWSKWKCPKPKFEPKTLQPFDRILVRNRCIENWGCSFLSNHRKDELFPFLTCDASVIKYCVPYNEETKHLVGTKDEAPEYYRYWED